MAYFFNPARWYRKMEGQMVRLVVDEAHKIFTDIVYRNSFSKLFMLAAYAIMKIYLSATMPPTLEKTFLSDSGMPSSMLFIRAPTTRPNLRYQVIQFENRLSHITKFAISVAKHLQTTTFTEDSRGIIYCTDIPTTNAVAASFNNCKSHSEMENSERLHHQNAWYEGHQQWMVATSGFLHGIDHPDVGAIIFINIPYGAINIEQGAGRAGRNGMPANVILLNSTNVHFAMRDGQSDPQCIEAATLWARTVEECRRYLMTLLMDGRGIRCGDLPGAEKCDTCDPDTELLRTLRQLADRAPTPTPSPTPEDIDVNMDGHALNSDEMFDVGDWDDDSLMNVDLSILQGSEITTPNTSVDAPIPIPPTIAPRKIAIAPRKKAIALPTTTKPSLSVHLDVELHRLATKRKRDNVARLSAMTKYLLGKCFVCWAEKKDCNVVKTDDHQWFVHCRKNQEFIPDAMGWFDLKKNFNFKAKYSHCYRCGLPQGDFLPSTHPEFVPGRHMECPFQDFTAVLAWYVFIHMDVFLEACKFFQGLHPGMKKTEFLKWSNEIPPGAFYNGLQLVIWLWMYRHEQ
jgi:hypothetical protein